VELIDSGENCVTRNAGVCRAYDSSFMFSLSPNYPAVLKLFCPSSSEFSSVSLRCELLLEGYGHESSLHMLLYGDLIYCRAVVCYFPSTRSTYQLRLAVNNVSVRLFIVTTLINSEMNGMRKEAVVALYDVLSRRLFGVTDKNHETPTRYSATGAEA
jgi:hypothetical protein